jgi:hypothetical protein
MFLPSLFTPMIVKLFGLSKMMIVGSTKVTDGVRII